MLDELLKEESEVETVEELFKMSLGKQKRKRRRWNS